jgi:co-chaperonin GroES (HSP10)
MEFPFKLYPGYVCVHSAATTQGILALTKDLQFGTIDQIFDSQNEFIKIGQSILFKMSDAVKIKIEGTDYYILNAERIILFENDVPAPTE